MFIECNSSILTSQICLFRKFPAQTAQSEDAKVAFDVASINLEMQCLQHWSDTVLKKRASFSFSEVSFASIDSNEGVMSILHVLFVAKCLQRISSSEVRSARASRILAQEHFFAALNLNVGRANLMSAIDN